MSVGPYHGFEQLYEIEYPSMLQLAYLMTGDRAEARDLTQESFARLLAEWDKVKDYDKPGAWTRRVLIRLCARSQSRGARVSRTEVEPAEADRSDAVGASHDITAAIQGLPLRQRTVIVATYWMGCSAAQTAQLVGCKEATVRVHLHRARITLARQLDREDWL